MRHIGVGEHNFLDMVLPYKAYELGFVMDGDPVRIARPGELSRVAAVAYERDLSGGEGYDFDSLVLAVDHVEVVEIASGGAHDQRGVPCVLSFGCRVLSRGCLPFSESSYRSLARTLRTPRR